LSDNVIIIIVPNSKGKEQVEVPSPFKASNKLRRSPLTTVRKEVEASTDMEVGGVSFSAGVNDQSTPIAARKTKGGMHLPRRAVEQSARTRGKPLPARNEAEDSAREDNKVPSSEVEGEEIMITTAEMRGFTQALIGAVQMMNALIKKMNLDREKNDSIKEINNVIKGIVSSMCLQ
jgi:hypothetical protein